MKALNLLFLCLALFVLSACDNDDDPNQEGYKVVWCPSLSQSLIGDGSITLQWPKYDGVYTKNDIDTKCVLPDYVAPQRIEIYQSDQETEGFTLIEEIRKTDTDVTHTIRNLPNGKPVYFRLKAIRKGYQDIETGSYQFIPNPKPASKIIYSHDGSQGRLSSISPDGKKVVIVHYKPEGNNTTYLCNLDGSDKVILEENSYDTFWSPDGTKLYLTGLPIDYSMGTATLKSYNPETKETTVIKEGIDYSYVPTVSPDGNKVLYNHYNNGGIDLYLYNIESGKDSLLVSRSIGSGQSFDYTEPLWVDNDIYLVKRNMLYSPFTSILSFVSLKDNKVEDVALNSYRYYNYAVPSPDNKNIVFMSSSNNHPQIALYNIESKTIRQLTGYENKLIRYRQHLTWKDNQTIYYIEYLSDGSVENVVELSIN